MKYTTTLKLSYIIYFILLSIFLYSCSHQKESSNIFRYNEAQGIENLDPVMSSNYPAIWPLNQCCEGLLEFDRNMTLSPLLASSYEISNDGIKYTFHLRKNVFFHDDLSFPNGKGRVVTSKDFKYCFERVCDPRTKTRGAWLFRDRVLGVEDYINFLQKNPSAGTSSNDMQVYGSIKMIH